MEAIKSIEINFENKWQHDIEFRHENREFDGVRIESWKNKTITMTAMKSNIPYCTIQKRLSINEKVKSFIDELTSRIKNERRNKLLVANMSSKVNTLKSLIKQYLKSNKSTLA